ncbi:MAG: L-glutamate gamma-semialdehyde dehydrogenase [Candidatus Lustribacter sp.]|jgi:1-pyrroline-5-carboxylate dehydrogenase
MARLAPSIEPFRNEPVRAFADDASRAGMHAALSRVHGRLGRTYPLVINGERLVGPGTIPSVNPARPHEIVGDVVAATPQDVHDALDAATAAFATWSRTPPAERAGFLFRAAAAVRERKDRFDALMIYEVGKTWVEADADTAEAIDFLEYYGREALRLADPPALVPSPLDEDNFLRYLPLGVGAIIPPWNFALAIMAGMTSAAIVTGNTVVLKPSPDAAVVAAEFVDLLIELGLPPGVVNFVPGDALTVGETLVADPRTRFISFTGSKAVGLRINEVAAKRIPGQRWIKRVIAELGGKDAIVVADDADLDAAAAGVVASAFGFSGQKCSAASRAIVDARVYDRFLDLIAEQTSTLRVGDPVDPVVDVGPVINARARERILDAIETGRAEGRLISGGGAAPGEGYFVEPTVIADVDPFSSLAQEEIFGPVLAVIRARDFDDALALANGTDFGLTGAVYTRDPDRIARAEDEFFVGNLYVNRKCTGALVGVHPFGGFNLSGTDSKAGGPDYLLQFLQAKAIAVSR